VFPRGLKTNIAITIAVLLMLSMFLIDFVMIIIAQRNLIRVEISKGNLIISAIEDNLIDYFEPEKVVLHSDFKKNLESMLSEAGFFCAIVQDKNNDRIYSKEKNCAIQDELTRLAEETIQSGERKTKYIGTTWGVFWKQKRDLIISAPLFKNEIIVAGASIAMQLSGVYQTMRRSQKILAIYIFINTLILTLIGIYRISKIYLQPMRRLVKQAEEYKEDDDIFFSARKEDNELKKLSKSLNSMIKRISDDKEKLRSTVRSLEKANFDLKQAQKEIIRAEKLASVGRLSAGIAHEIGNPMGIIIGYLDLLKQKDIKDKEKNEFITRTEKEINRINTIIRQLLDFSRPSKEGMRAVSAHEIIEDVSNVINVQPFMSNINLELSLKAEKDIIHADPNQLRQVFLNLMINAADAVSSSEASQDGKIIIKSEVVSGSDFDFKDQETLLKLMFIDTGVGVPKETLGNIFDPFYTTKEPGKGTGLGLSVSFMIIESMGGTIKATSEQSKGTTLIICLPFYEEAK